jgi:transmembrane sensor
MSDPDDVRAEAAAWLAWRRSDDWTSGSEVAFRSWLDESPDHYDAFEEINTVWDAVGSVNARPSWAAKPDKGRLMLSRRAALAGGGAAICSAGLAFTLLRPTPALAEASYTTAVGEQKRIILFDGSLALLDTDSRIDVSFSEKERTLQLIKGRAHLDVAKDRLRPFVVSGTTRRVTALGTSFDIFQDEKTFSVALLEGRVTVQPRGSEESPVIATLTPGERLVSTGQGPDRLDTFNPVQATAWQSGKIVLNNELLSDAVAEVNRYSRHAIVLSGPAMDGLRVSGVYDLTDANGFAEGIALLHSLHVTSRGNDILLSPGST